MKKVKYFNINDLYLYNKYAKEQGSEPYMDSDDFDELFADAKPTEIMRMCEYGNCKFKDPYYRVDEYGNLDSFTTLQVEDNINDDMDFFNYWLEYTFDLKTIKEVHNDISKNISNCKSVKDLAYAFGCTHDNSQGDKYSPFAIDGVGLRTNNGKTIETFTKLQKEMDRGSKWEDITDIEVHFWQFELGLNLYCYMDDGKITDLHIEIFYENELVAEDCTLEDLGLQEVIDLDAEFLYLEERD